VLVTIGGELKDAKRFGGRNWLLDMTPETTSRTDSALAVGRTYSDPDPMGPRITVLAADATKATIRVELAGGGGNLEEPGMGVCDDGTPLTAPGPETCAAPPVTADGGSAAGDAGARDGSARDGALADGTGRDASQVNDAASPRDAVDVGGGDVAVDVAAADAAAAPPAPPEDAAPPTARPTTPTGGCACRTGPSSDASAPALLFAVVLLGALCRPRRLGFSARHQR
jgi:MYXO-CTERM domain-containing protein